MDQLLVEHQPSLAQLNHQQALHLQSQALELPIVQGVTAILGARAAEEQLKQPRHLS